MKYLLSICLMLSCATAWPDDSVSLKPGDVLTIMFDDSSGFEISVKAIAKAAAPVQVAAPVDEYEVVYQQVCVNGVCSIQPVRRLVNRTATAINRVAAKTAVAFAPVTSYTYSTVAGDGTCGCGCPNCTCGNAATTARQRLFAPRLLFWRR